jgi:hypothetical protein
MMIDALSNSLHGAWKKITNNMLYSFQEGG